MSQLKQTEVTEHLTVWGFADRDEPFPRPVHIEVTGMTSIHLDIKMELDEAKTMARALGSAIQHIENVNAHVCSENDEPVDCSGATRCTVCQADVLPGDQS